MQEDAILRPDAKGRITLGKLAKGVSSYRVTIDQDHRIILEPFAEVPAREKWLFDNPEALASVRRGLQDAKANNVSERGSFSSYLDDED